MSFVHADLRIEARWILPMTVRGQVLENHALVVRDGRILDLLPAAQAAERYTATLTVERPAHVLMPGMINAHTRGASTMFRGAEAPAPLRHDAVLTAIAEMLMSGITCFSSRCRYPDETARTVSEQAMRAVMGLPLADTAAFGANCAADYLTTGLRVRDEFKGHPLISTAFAPDSADKLSDATFARLVTLTDELDAGIVIDLHESADAIARSVALHGVRPIERLWHLGMLTPALNAVHMTHATAADIGLAKRTGITISAALSSSLGREHQLPPLASFIESGIALGLGSGGAQRRDVWEEMRLFALLTSHLHPAGGSDHGAWDALAAVTRGNAAILGLDGDTGTLEPRKWADLCCVDLESPATQPLHDPVAQLVFCGCRGMVSDVWVAGRQLKSDGELTRLDWRRAAARVAASTARINIGA